MSRYGYLDLFQSPLEFEITRVDCVSSNLQVWYVEIRISRRISESPLDFEITRVDCISSVLQIWYVEVRISRPISESLGIRDNESWLCFLNSASLICRGTDISTYFRESLGLRDNESRLYILPVAPMEEVHVMTEHTPHMKPPITKTRLYNFDPLKPHFYIVKLGATGIYIIFLVSAQKIGCGYSLEPPVVGTHNLCFWAEVWKILEFFIWLFFFIFLYPATQ